MAVKTADQRRTRLALVGVALLAAVAMLPVVANEFTNWDDPETIYQNWRVTPPSWLGLWSHWSSQHMSLYVPVTYTAWAVVSLLAHWTTGAPHPAFFHAASLLLHASTAAAVFLLILRVLPVQATPPGGARAWATRRPIVAAFCGAAVFAIHPLQVESVAWASGLKDVLMGLLSASCLLQLVRAQDVWAQPKSRRRRLIAAAGLLILAMLAKPTAVVVPLMAVPLLRLCGASWRRIGAIAASGLALALPVVLLTRAVQPAERVVDAGPLWARPLIAADAHAFYLYKVVWPVGLAPDYGRTPGVVLDAGTYRWAWAIPAAVALAAVLLRRRHPAVACGLALAAIPILPVSGLLPFEFQMYSTVADHYTYLAFAGVGLVVGGALAAVRGSAFPKPAALGVLGILGLLIVLDWRQAMVWRSAQSLFTHTVAVNPRSWGAYNNLATLALSAGRLDEAGELARRALEANPQSVQARVTLGNVLHAGGDVAASESAYREALRVAPNDPVVLANLGGLLGQQGREGEALELLEHAVRVEPQLASARLNLGTLLAMRGRYAEAEEHLRAAMRFSPRDANALTNLAVVLLERGGEQEAVSLLRRALEVDPNHAAARNVMARIARR